MADAPGQRAGAHRRSSVGAVVGGVSLVVVQVETVRRALHRRGTSVLNLDWVVGQSCVVASFDTRGAGSNGGEGGHNGEENNETHGERMWFKFSVRTERRRQMKDCEILETTPCSLGLLILPRRPLWMSHL